MNNNKPQEPRPRRGRRSRSPEENLKVMALKLLEERAAANPMVGDAIIAKVFGIDIPKVDRLAAVKEELEAEILKLGLQDLKNDPELRKTITRSKLFEWLNVKEPEKKPKAPPKPRQNSLDQAIILAEKINELKEVTGGKEPGLLDKLDPAFVTFVLSAMLAAVKNRPGQGASPAPPEAPRIYMDFVNGQPQEMTKEEFETRNGTKPDAYLNN